VGTGTDSGPVDGDGDADPVGAVEADRVGVGLRVGGSPSSP
jgi:hypothetical protein